jgi:AraC-like DNA-binding protein
VSGHYISSAILAGSTPLISGMGGDAISIAEAVGLDPGALADPALPVLTRDVVAFFEHAAEACQTRYFGLLMASQADMTHLGALWLLLRHARTLEEMLEDFAAHFEFYTRDVSIDLARGKDGHFVIWTAGSNVGINHVQMAEYALAVVCAYLRSHASAGWEPEAVYFQHAAPPTRQMHRQVFGRHVAFDRELNAIFVERALLARPLRGPRSSNRALMSRILRQETLSADDTLDQRVDTIVRTRMPYARCTLADTCEALGMAPRTLQGALNAKQTSFKKIKDSVRASLALKYLRDSNLELYEIAEILGFSELSAFSRAFRRWYGCTASSERRARVREKNEMGVKTSLHTSPDTDGDENSRSGLRPV